MMNATITQVNALNVGCQADVVVIPPMVCAPTIGRVVCPRMPMAAQAMQEAIVKPTTHDLRRRRASESAPSTGTERTTRNDETPLPSAYKVLDAPRSLISHTEK